MKALYPGTFDPITRGHLDIVERAAEIFDGLELAVVESSSKELAFSSRERLELAIESVEEAGLQDSVEVTLFDGLLVEYMRSRGLRVFIRGLRATSDFEYEFQMQLMNRRLAPEITGIYLMPAENNMYISSTLVREIARYRGDLSSFVMPSVGRALKSRIGMGAPTGNS
jgi:pantetheine-phosphate adenylyltransferase